MNNQYIYTNGFLDELFSTRELFTLRLKELLEYKDTKHSEALSNTLTEFFSTLNTLASQNSIQNDGARKKSAGWWLLFLSLFSSNISPKENRVVSNSERETNLKFVVSDKLKELTLLLDKGKFTREDRLVDIAILYAERVCARKDFKEDIEDMVERAQEITKFGKRKPYAEILFKYIMREGESWSPFLTMAIMFEYKEVLNSLSPREIHESINGKNGEWMLILRDMVINKKLTTKKHLKNLLKYSK